MTYYVIIGGVYNADKIHEIIKTFLGPGSEGRVPDNPKRLFTALQNGHILDYKDKEVRYCEDYPFQYLALKTNEKHPDLDDFLRQQGIEFSIEL